MFGRKKRKGGEQINVDLPITPMLDMAFQILAFFVVIFRPTPQEGQISMYLPKAEGQEQSVVIPPPSETPIDVPKEYTVRASASSDGMAAALTFIDEAGREPLAGAGPDVLYNRLKTIALPAGTERPKVRIEADGNLVYAELVRLMDEAVRAGFENIGVGLLRTEGGEAAPEGGAAPPEAGARPQQPEP